MNKKAMRLSFSVNDVSDEAFAEYSAGGIGTIELSLGSKRFFPFAGFAGLSKRAEKHGIEVNSIHLPFEPFGQINIASMEAELRNFTIEFFGEQLKLAGDAGIPIAVIHPSGEPILPENRDESMKYAKESLAKLAETARRNGMTLAVEDLPRTCLGNTIEEIKDLISADEGLRVCFDTNHLLTQQPHDFVYALGDKIITTHISDYDFRNERHWLPYEGKIDWIRLVTALEETGYTGVFNYELSLKAPDTITRRDLTFTDIIENYTACMEKRPAAVLGKPNMEVCDARSYYKEA